MVEEIRQGDIPGVQLRCRHELSVPRAQAWLWLTEPDRLCQWLAPTVVSRAGLEVDVRLESDTVDEGTIREDGSTVELVRPHRWVLDLRQLDAGWPVATRLTLELSPTAGGCELSILQQGFEHLPLSGCLTVWEFYRRRWRSALERLAELVSEA